MRRIVWPFIALAVIAWIVIGIREYRARQLPDIAPEIVKNASLRFNDCMSYQVLPSNTTYGELLEKLQKNVTEIDSRIIDLQSAQTAKNDAKVKLLLTYLHAGLDVLRAQSMATRKQMETNGAFERGNDAYRDYMESSGYGEEYAKRSLDRAREAFAKNLTEYKDSHDTLKRSLTTLASTRDAAAKLVPPAVLCDPQIISKMQKHSDDQLLSIASAMSRQ